MRCAQGDYLVGLSARYGSVVDAIAPLCARWEDGRFLPPGLGPYRGGSGGSVGEIRCDQNSAITTLLIETAPNQWRSVGLLVPICGSALETGRRTQRIGLDQFGTGIADRRRANDTEEIGTSVSVDYNWSVMPSCREGDIAVGVYGGAGAYVDRLGLICAPAPRRIVMMPPVILSPPAPVSTGGGVADADRVTPLIRRCRSGYVWREAGAGDHVCVTPESRDRARLENAAAASRVNPQGAYGPQSCISGFVWREAFEGDLVCVTPEVRSLVHEENASAGARTE